MRNKILTAITIVMFLASITAPLVFGNPKPFAFLPAATIERVRPKADSRDRAMLRLMHLLSVPIDISVVPGGDVQAAINSVQPGDTITLQAGASYPGSLTLPVKSGATYITIQSSRANELPEGRRVSPDQSPLLAKLQSPTNAEPIVKTVAGAHHYRFIGIQFSTANEGVFVYDLIRLGDGKQTQKTLDQVPHHFVFDRCYITGFKTQDVMRGIAMNAAEVTVSNSYIAEIHGVGFEAQALNAWNGPGPFHIINNYLNAAGENVMFGGADSASPELMPANLEVRRNYMFKPPSWNPKDPSFTPVIRNGQSLHWTVKNIFELKAVRGAVVDGNIFENNWVDAQAGEAILFTTRNQDCGAPWSVVEDVTFTNNTVRNATGALTFIGMDNEVTAAFGKCNPASTSGQGNKALVANNLFHNISGTFLQLAGFNDLTIGRNTHLQAGNTITFFGGQVSQGFVYRENVTQEKPYGIRDENGIEGVAALDKWAPGYVFANNVMATPYTKNPPGNDYPSTLTIDSDFRTPYTGKGADIYNLKAAQSGDIVTIPTSSPTPSVSPTPVATPTPVASPSPSPSPIATPTPTPSPTPTPAVCTMTVNSPAIPQWGSGKLVVNLSGFNSPATLSAASTSGQVWVSPPTTRPVTGTSTIVEFGLQAKKKSSSVIVNGPCGSQTVLVNVR